VCVKSWLRGTRHRRDHRQEAGRSSAAVQTLRRDDQRARRAVQGRTWVGFTMVGLGSVVVIGPVYIARPNTTQTIFCSRSIAVQRTAGRGLGSPSMGWVHRWTWLQFTFFFCFLLFWHAPLGARSAIRRHQAPQRTVLGQVDCFVQCEVVGSQIMLDGVQPRDTRTL